MRTLPLHLTPEQRCNFSEVSQLMPFTGLLWLLFTCISRRRRVGHRCRLNYPANVIHSFALIWWNVFSFSLINEIYQLHNNIPFLILVSLVCKVSPCWCRSGMSVLCQQPTADRNSADGWVMMEPLQRYTATGYRWQTFSSGPFFINWVCETRD